MSPMMNPAMLEAQRKQQIEQIKIMLKHNAQAVASTARQAVILRQLPADIRTLANNAGQFFFDLGREEKSGAAVICERSFLSMGALLAGYVDIMRDDNEYRLGGLNAEGDRMREALEQLESPILMPGFIPPGSSSPLRQ